MKYLNVNKIYEELKEIKSRLRASNFEPLTFKQAAEYLNFSETYLYQLTSQNKIPFYKPNGKKILFDKTELNKWIIKSRVHTSDEIEENYTNGNRSLDKLQTSAELSRESN